jgi:hypothetical protein
MRPEIREQIRQRNLGHAAPHLAAGPSHPRSRAVSTPHGTYGNATLAATAFGITRQAAAHRARAALFGWSYTTE